VIWLKEVLSLTFASGMMVVGFPCLLLTRDQPPLWPSLVTMGWGAGGLVLNVHYQEGREV